jgi:acetamidase/formamidase
MDVVEIVPTSEQLAFTFGGVAPLRRIMPGTALRLWSEDAFCGVLQSTKDLASEKVDLRFVNPQTGPFYVAGAEPGDTLAIHFVAMEPAGRMGAPQEMARAVVFLSSPVSAFTTGAHPLVDGALSHGIQV